MQIHLRLLLDSFLADLACRDAGNECSGYFGHGGLDGDSLKVRNTDPGSKTTARGVFIEVTLTELFLVFCCRKINMQIRK